MEEIPESTKPDLVEYVRNARAVGMSDAQIPDELLNGEWRAADIERIWSQARSKKLAFRLLAATVLVVGTIAYGLFFWPRSLTA
jgi:hypothetical protein